MVIIDMLMESKLHLIGGSLLSPNSNLLNFLDRSNIKIVNIIDNRIDNKKG